MFGFLLNGDTDEGMNHTTQEISVSWNCEAGNFLRYIMEKNYTSSLNINCWKTKPTPSIKVQRS